MRRRLCILPIAIALITCVPWQGCRTNAMDLQQFHVGVGPWVWLSSPVDTSNLTHDMTNADQAFPETRWTAINTSFNGAVVTFSTMTAFTHTADPSYKRDAELSVRRIFGSNNWTVDVPVDRTAYSAPVPDEVATVRVSCTGPALAIFGLTTTFITDDVNTLLGGDYEAVVIGTISANP